MAAAIAEQGAGFHGVLHKMSSAEQAALNKIEGGYDPTPCKVKLYSGDIIDAIVYVLGGDKNNQGKERVDKPPAERYIDIITAGCKHFGVKQEYIDHLRSIEFQPRKKPEDFDKLTVPEGVPTMTLADVEKGDGKDGNPLMTTLNGKVLKHGKLWPVIEAGIKANKAKDIHSYEVLQNTFLFDPKYGIIKS